MEPNQEIPKLRSFREYLPKIIKFYQLRNENFAKIIFVLVLGLTFLSSFYFPFSILEGKIAINNNNLFIFLLIMIAIDLVGVCYLYAFIRELRGKEYSIKSLIFHLLKKFWIIVLGYIVYTFVFIFGTLLIIVPGIILSIMFMFYICYVVDLGEGVKYSFEASKEITKGNKMKLFIIMLIFIVFFYIINLFIVSSITVSGRTLMITFASSFFGTIQFLSQKRLLALMYMDLEYYNELKIPPDKGV